MQVASAEKVKQDRAKYVEHLQGIKDGTAASHEPLGDSLIEPGDEEEGPDIEIPTFVTKVP